MVERPRDVVFATATALVGAFFVFMAIVVGMDITADDFGLKAGFCLLSLILFLAVAGSLMKNGQWSWKVLLFMEVVCTVIPAFAFIFEAMDLLYFLAAMVLGCVTIVFTATAETRRWIEADRI